MSRASEKETMAILTASGINANTILDETVGNLGVGRCSGKFLAVYILYLVSNSNT